MGFYTPQGAKTKAHGWVVPPAMAPGLPLTAAQHRNGLGHVEMLRIHCLITLEFHFQLHPSCPGLGETIESNVQAVSKERLQLEKIKSIRSRKYLQKRMSHQELVKSYIYSAHKPRTLVNKPTNAFLARMNNNCNVQARGYK